MASTGRPTLAMVREAPGACICVAEVPELRPAPAATMWLRGLPATVCFLRLQCVVLCDGLSNTAPSLVLSRGLSRVSYLQARELFCGAVRVCVAARSIMCKQ